MSQNYCLHCFQPQADSHLYCQVARDQYRFLLGCVPDLLRELDVTLSKQDRIGSTAKGGRVKGHEKPLIYRQHASEARDRIVAESVFSDFRFVRRQFPLEDRGPKEPMAFLVFMTDRMAHYEWFGEVLTRLDDAVNAGMDAIDLARGRLEAGTCDQCGTRMQGCPEEPMVACSSCGATYAIEERQRQMFIAAQDHLVTATQAEVYLGFFVRLEELRRAEGLPGVLGPLADEPFNGALVRKWAHRGHLEEYDRHIELGVTPLKGWPVYRWGDIIRVAIDQIAKAEDRKHAGAVRRAATALRAQEASKEISESAA